MNSFRPLRELLRGSYFSSKLSAHSLKCWSFSRPCVSRVYFTHYFCITGWSVFIFYRLLVLAHEAGLLKVDLHKV